MGALVPDQFNPMLLQIIGGLLGLLVILIAWIGNRIHNRLDEISRTLVKIERDLRNDLSKLDRRVTRLEEHSKIVISDEEWRVG